MQGSPEDFQGHTVSIIKCLSLTFLNLIKRKWLSGIGKSEELMRVCIDGEFCGKEITRHR